MCPVLNESRRTTAMSPKIMNLMILAVASVAALTPTKFAAAQSQVPAWFDELANSAFPEGQPTRETVQMLKDELLFQRAAQTYLWAMPAIMTLGMQVSSEQALGAGYNVVPIFKTLTHANTLVITPNTVT